MLPYLSMSFQSNGLIMAEVFNHKPIGFFKSDKINNYDVPRQSGLNETPIENPDYIELEQGHQFEQALEDLQGFSHLWILFEFHKNKTWNPKVMPPRGGDSKRGVFATRSPYRPNPIGISCVEIIRIQGLKIFISSSDLLNGTPILDIKPYIPEYDSFPKAQIGWLEKLHEQKYEIHYSVQAQDQLQYLQNNGPMDLEPFIKRSLEFDPLNKDKKRLILSKDLDISTNPILCYRTWRISFQVNKDNKTITIYDIFSGYTHQDLQNTEDTYLDKELHRKYINFIKSKV